MDSLILPELPTYLFAPNLAGVLSLILTFILPLVAALFMRTTWTTFVKGLVLLAAAAVKTFLEAWLVAVDAHTAFNFAEVTYATLVNLGIAVIAYFGFLRDTGVQRSALAGGVVRDKVIDGHLVA